MADRSNALNRVPLPRTPAGLPSDPRIGADATDSPHTAASVSFFAGAPPPPRRQRLAPWPVQLSPSHETSVGAREPRRISVPAPRPETEVARVPRSDERPLAPILRDHVTMDLPWPALLVADDAEPMSWLTIERSHQRAERLAREQAGR